MEDYFCLRNFYKQSIQSEMMANARKEFDRGDFNRLSFQIVLKDRAQNFSIHFVRRNNGTEISLDYLLDCLFKLFVFGCHSSNTYPEPYSPSNLRKLQVLLNLTNMIGLLQLHVSLDIWYCIYSTVVEAFEQLGGRYQSCDSRSR